MKRSGTSQGWKKGREVAEPGDAEEKGSQPSHEDQSEQKPPAKKRSRSQPRAVASSGDTGTDVPFDLYERAGLGAARPPEAPPIRQPRARTDLRQEALPTSHLQFQVDPGVASFLATSGEEALMLARERELSTRLALLSNLSQPVQHVSPHVLGQVPPLNTFLDHPAPLQQHLLRLSRENEMLRALAGSSGSSHLPFSSYSNAALLEGFPSQHSHLRNLAQAQSQLEQNQLLQALAGSTVFPGSHPAYSSSAGTSPLFARHPSQHAHGLVSSSSTHPASLSHGAASLPPPLLSHDPDRMSPATSAAARRHRPSSHPPKPPPPPQSSKLSKPPPQRNRPGAAASAPPAPPAPERVECRYHPRAVAASSPSDRARMSGYQALLREQMVYAEATALDARATTQGRNRPVRAGQVGLLCRHCRNIPPHNRPRASVYFPQRLASIYQSAQNMANHHFGQGRGRGGGGGGVGGGGGGGGGVGGGCPNAPDGVNESLWAARERDGGPVVYGGGQQYWAATASDAGLVETEDGLRFSDSRASQAAGRERDPKHLDAKMG